MDPLVDLVLDAKATLGEGAIWDARRQLLCWIDILEGRVHFFNPTNGDTRTIMVGQSIGSIVPRASGGYILALEDGFAALNSDSGKLTLLHDPESHLPGNRFNDAKCDPAGRFWAGTMAKAQREPGAGSLYRMDTDLSVRRMLTDVTVSNGISWSVDRETMYFTDSSTRTVSAFDFDVATGEISNRRDVIRFTKEDGFPDGITIDSEDMLWIAHWAGGRVSRWHPSMSKMLQTIAVPATQVTSCAFGGADLATLYITTARTGLDSPQLATQPLAGGLFAVRPGARGIAAFEFAG